MSLLPGKPTNFVNKIELLTRKMKPFEWYMRRQLSTFDQSGNCSHTNWNSWRHLAGTPMSFGMRTQENIAHLLTKTSMTRRLISWLSQSTFVLRTELNDLLF